MIDHHSTQSMLDDTGPPPEVGPCTRRPAARLTPLHLLGEDRVSAGELEELLQDEDVPLNLSTSHCQLSADHTESIPRHTIHSFSHEDDHDHGGLDDHYHPGQSTGTLHCPTSVNTNPLPSIAQLSRCRYTYRDARVLPSVKHSRVIPLTSTREAYNVLIPSAQSAGV
jgi:hypothetical protein